MHSFVAGLDFSPHEHSYNNKQFGNKWWNVKEAKYPPDSNYYHTKVSLDQ